MNSIASLCILLACAGAASATVLAISRCNGPHFATIEKNGAIELKLHYKKPNLEVCVSIFLQQAVHEFTGCPDTHST